MGTIHGVSSRKFNEYTAGGSENRYTRVRELVC